MIDFILGVIFGLLVLLFIRITIVTRKLNKLIRDIDDAQNRIEDRIGKLTSDFNDIIRKKV